MNASLTKNNQMQKTLVLHYSGSVTDRKVSNTHTHRQIRAYEICSNVKKEEQQNKNAHLFEYALCECELYASDNNL